MPLTTRIDLPAPSRSGGGLLAAARPLPAGWERGVTFADDWCISPQPWPFCIGEPSPGDSPGEKTFGTVEVAEFEPTGIVAGVACTTLSTDRAQDDANETLLAVADFQLGRELADGAVTGNPSLGDGITAGSAADFVEALAVIEQAIADGLYGRLGYVHVCPGDLTRLLSAQVLYRDGRAWRTGTGNTVVSSAGYDFCGTIHATGEVFASVSPAESRASVDRAVNTTEAYAEQVGLAAFAPCFNVYVEVTS